MANFIVIKETKINIGDTVKAYQKIKEGEKERIQIFEGVLIAIKNKGETRSITLRKIAANNIGVEKIWPINSPNLEKVIVKKKGNVKRAKLYYLRHKFGKQAVRIKEKKEIKLEKNEEKKPRKPRRKPRAKTPSK